MTNEKMNRLAKLVANEVVKQIEVKQQQWDIDFQADMEHYVSTSTADMEINIDTPKDFLNKELKKLQNDLKLALESESFEKCKIIDEKIVKINKKLLNL